MGKKPTVKKVVKKMLSKAPMMKKVVKEMSIPKMKLK